MSVMHFKSSVSPLKFLIKLKYMNSIILCQRWFHTNKTTSGQSYKNIDPISLERILPIPQAVRHIRNSVITLNTELLILHKLSQPGRFFLVCLFVCLFLKLLSKGSGNLSSREIFKSWEIEKACFGRLSWKLLFKIIDITYLKVAPVMRRKDRSCQMSEVQFFINRCISVCRLLQFFILLPYDSVKN